MQVSIGRSRHGCNLHGALQTLAGIDGVVPIIHSTSGCGIQNDLANRKHGSSIGYVNGYTIPCSNLFEKQVVFGGTSRLREQIKNTVKILKGDLYVPLSGCGSEMVGDDIISMTQEIVSQGEAAIYYKAPGFKGSQHTGYEGILKAIFSQLPEVADIKNEKITGLVNILGILPVQDIYWQGNLNETKRMLEEIGIKVNPLFGYGQGIEQWKMAYRAQLNVVVSKWGISGAAYLEEKYGTPYIIFDDIGLGEEETGCFIRETAKRLGIDSDKVEPYLNEKKNQFVYSLEQIMKYYFTYEFQKTAAIVGDESTVIRYSKFLTKYLGIKVEVGIITDYIREEDGQRITEQLQGWIKKIYISKDGVEIEKLIKNSGIELILGSGLENAIGKKLGIPNYIVSYPPFKKVIIGKSDVGYAGAISLLEDLSSLLIQ